VRQSGRPRRSDPQAGNTRASTPYEGIVGLPSGPQPDEGRPDEWTPVQIGDPARSAGRSADAECGGSRTGPSPRPCTCADERSGSSESGTTTPTSRLFWSLKRVPKPKRSVRVAHLGSAGRDFYGSSILPR
jgi:hypothetical protein